MNSYSVITKPGCEYHFKVAVSAFDPQSKLSLVDGKFVVESDKLTLEDVRSLTSVKEATLANDIIVYKTHQRDYYFKQTRSYVGFDPHKLTLDNLADMFKDAHDMGILLYDATVYCERNGNSFVHETALLNCKRVIDFKKTCAPNMLNSLVTINWDSLGAAPNEYSLYCNSLTVPPRNSYILRVEIRTSFAAVLHCL